MRRRRRSEHFGGAGLIIAHRLAALPDVISHCLEQPERAERIDVGSILRDIKGHLHVTLSPEIIDFVRPDLLQNVSKRRPVGQVAVVERELEAPFMRIAVEIVDPVSVEKTGPAYDPVNLVAFVQEKIDEIRSILASHAGN